MASGHRTRARAEPQWPGGPSGGPIWFLVAICMWQLTVQTDMKRVGDLPGAFPPPLGPYPQRPRHTMAGVCHLATDSGVCCPHRPVIALPGDPGPFLRALRCDALWQGQFQGMRPGLGATPPPVQAGGPRWGRAPRTLPGLPTRLQYPWAPGEGWGARPGLDGREAGLRAGYLCAPSSRAGGPRQSAGCRAGRTAPSPRPSPGTTHLDHWASSAASLRAGPGGCIRRGRRGTASSAHAGSAAKSTCQSSSASVRRSQDVSPPDCHCGGRAGRGRSTRPVPAPRTSWGRPAQLRGRCWVRSLPLLPGARLAAPGPGHGVGLSSGARGERASKGRGPRRS